MMQHDGKRRAQAISLAPLLSFGLLLAIVIARSWLCDDAYITLRTVDNLAHGFGPRWNVSDRVQTYTHPLWMGLLAIPYAFTREPYFTTLVLSWLLTAVAAAILLLRLAATPLSTAWAGLTLALSSAFTDFSTSGLENPLSHALLAACLACAQRARLGAATFAASLLVLSRPDAALLVAPLLTTLAWSVRRSPPWAALVLGLAPALLWAAFALAYYGFVWPNTAYAKLGSGVPASDLAAQGLMYLLESLRNDPLTLATCAGALTFASIAGDVQSRALALGMALYLGWIVSFGGDFMSGRFLTLPFFAAVCTIARLPPGSLGPGRIRLALALLGVLLGASSPRASWRLQPSRFATLQLSGIADERSFYLPATGLAARLRSGPDIEHEARHKALALRAKAPALIRLRKLGCGIFGYYAGPGVHIVDEWSITDPLLARLPAMRQLHWRIGHFVRVVPSGYLPTLADGRNQFQDPQLARYWDQLALVTRARLFEPARWRAIVAFALGTNAKLIDPERYRLADLVRVPLERIAVGDPVRFGDGGLEIRLGQPLSAARLEIVLEGGDRFAVSAYAGKTQVATQETSANAVLSVSEPGVDRVRVLPLAGASSYRVMRCTVE